MYELYLNSQRHLKCRLAKAAVIYFLLSFNRLEESLEFLRQTTAGFSYFCVNKSREAKRSELHDLG